MRALLKVLRYSHLALDLLGVSTTPTSQDLAAIILCKDDHHRAAFVTELHAIAHHFRAGCMQMSIKHFDWPLVRVIALW